MRDRIETQRSISFTGREEAFFNMHTSNEPQLRSSSPCSENRDGRVSLATIAASRWKSE